MFFTSIISRNYSGQALNRIQPNGAPPPGPGCPGGCGDDVPGNFMVNYWPEKMSRPYPEIFNRILHEKIESNLA